MQRDRHLPWLAGLLLSISCGLTVQASACGLEPGIRGGFTVSHPQSLDVAVAVAEARRNGLLAPVDQREHSNAARLRMMVADLTRLQRRLNRGRETAADDSNERFSLVLVGPGLWSHFHVTPGGLLARYHVDGPFDGKVVVLTHHAVLEALLDGALVIEQAAEHGLLVFSGDNTQPVQAVFRQGFMPRG